MGLRSVFSLGRSVGLVLLAIGLIIVVVGVVLWLISWVITVIAVILGVVVAFLGFEVFTASTSAEEVYETAATVAPTAYSAFDGWMAKRRADSPYERRLPSDYAPDAVRDLTRRYIDPFLAPDASRSGGVPGQYQVYPPTTQQDRPSPTARQYHYSQQPQQQLSRPQASGQPQHAPSGEGPVGQAMVDQQTVPRYCQWCGTELSHLGTFCPRCGRAR
jgi:hypothetical protein